MLTIDSAEYFRVAVEGMARSHALILVCLLKLILEAIYMEVNHGEE